MKHFTYEETLAAQKHLPQIERVMASDVIYVIETEADYSEELPEELRKIFATREVQDASAAL